MTQGKKTMKKTTNPKGLRSFTWPVVGTATVLMLCLQACSGTATKQVDGAEQQNKSDIYGVSVQRDTQAKVQKAFFERLPVDCDNPMACPTIGLHWTADKPRQVVLQAGFVRGQHAQIEMVEFLARPYGPVRVRSLAPEQASSNVQGEVALQMPMASLDRIVVSRGVLLRVTTVDGRVYEESLVSGEHASPAFNGLRRWLQQIYEGSEKEQALGLNSLFAKPSLD